MSGNGGPAFARPASEFTKNGTLHDGNDAVEAQDGLSLRDFFAAKALDFALRVTADNDGSFDHVAAATTAYRIADELLKAREERR